MAEDKSEFSSRDEWLAMRRGGLGASDVAAVLGLSETRTAYDIYAVKLGLVEDLEASERMEWGKEFEQVIARKWARDRGIKIAWLDQTIQGPEPWIYATPDFGVVDLDQGGDSKNIAYQTDEWGEENTDQIPPYYAAQAHWQMIVTGWSRVWFPVLFGGNRLQTYVVHRDEAVEKAMLDVCGDFWKRHVEAQQAPPIDFSESASRVLLETFPHAKEPAREASEEEIDLAADFARARAAKRAAERDYKTLANQLKERIGDAKAIVGPDFKLSWYEMGGSTYTVTRKPTRVLKGSGGLFKGDVDGGD